MPMTTAGGGNRTCRLHSQSGPGGVSWESGGSVCVGGERAGARPAPVRGAGLRQVPGVRSAGARFRAGALRELQGRASRRLLVQGARGVPLLQREARACNGRAPGGAGPTTYPGPRTQQGSYPAYTQQRLGDEVARDYNLQGDAYMDIKEMKLAEGLGAYEQAVKYLSKQLYSRKRLR
jgi:hypothetical protein